jgi:hypothetical protein
MFDSGTGGAGSGQMPSSSGGAAGTGAPGTPTCQQICDRVAQAGCAIDHCAENCIEPLTKSPSCAPEFEAALQCFVRAPLACVRGGDDAEFSGCDRERDLATQCFKRTASPPPAPVPTPPATSQPVPSTCLGAAPVMPSGMACSGGGSSGTTSGAGGNAVTTCQNVCTDSAGNVWSSDCVGSTCSCIYNGTTYCTCTSTGTGPCSSCCPGI